MKRFLLILVAMLVCHWAVAQEVTDNSSDMKYKDLKEYYSYKDYTKLDDMRYSPGGVGLASFLIPGLGEMICGEGWRGAAFLGGWLASHFVTLEGIANLSDAIYYTGVVGALAMRVISTVDATRVAKVKNMYYLDQNGRYGLEVNLYPSMNYTKTAEGIKPSAGLTLAVRF